MTKSFLLSAARFVVTALFVWGHDTEQRMGDFTGAAMETA